MVHFKNYKQLCHCFFYSLSLLMYAFHNTTGKTSHIIAYSTTYMIRYAIIYHHSHNYDNIIDADICAGQCLYLLTLKMSSTFSGTSKNLKIIIVAFPVMLATP